MKNQELRSFAWFAPLFFFLLLVHPGYVQAADTETENTAAPPADGEFSTGVENSVVKVFSTVRSPDFSKPWSKQAPREVGGSGVIIEGKRILTNAHVVQYASQVQVQAYQSGDKIGATVEAFAPGIDLAVLKLEDESLFDARPPLARASVLPKIKDTVMAYGYPTGGTNLSITRGIVSRIDFASYRYPVSGLRIQIDAAINPGNSGGPALVGDMMIGLAFSSLSNTQNIGYIIPCEEIEIFLADIADGRYDGKPALFDELQTLENPALRSFLKLDSSIEGIVVHEPYRSDPGYPLKEWDVIAKIGDTNVDNQGMIRVGDNRLRFTYLVRQLARDGKVSLTIIREGKEQTVEVPVTPDRPKLIPYLHGEYPPYFVYGPMVFTIATEDHLAAFGTTSSRIMTTLSIRSNPLATRRGEQPAFDGEELVIVPAPFFPHRLARGYSPPLLQVVQSVNGVAIKNLRDLVEVLRDAGGEFITFEFTGRGGESLIFPRQEMLGSTEDILADNGIRSQGSPELMEVWNAKPAKQGG